MGETIVCPSGLSGVVRGLKGKEARMLSDLPAIRSGKFLDNILNACWEETVDPGPYSFTGKPDWSQVLIGDRFFILLKIRIRTFGAAFGFTVQCASQVCRQKFAHEIDLEQLQIKALPLATRDALKAGLALTGTLPDGQSFTFRLMTGADEVRMAKGNANPTVATMNRIVKLGDLDEIGKRRYFDEGELSLVYSAIDEMDRQDCGVDTKVAVDCPQCWESMQIEIPFDQGFLRPKTKN